MTRSETPLKPDLDRMISLLDQEQRALKRADMAGLIRLAPRKEAVLARLEAGGASERAQAEPLVRKIRKDAARNALLFEAALRGLKDARALIDRCITRQGDQIYARNGARHLVDPPQGTLEKRA